MRHALSTHVFVNHRLTTVWLDRIWQAGIPAVEIFCARQHIDWHNRAQIAELGHWFRDAELKLHSLHSPMYNDDVWGRTGPNAVVTITETNKSKRTLMIDEIKRALEIAEIVPIRYMIQHLGVGDEEYDERKLDAAFTALEELSLFAKQRGAQILLENIPNKLSSAERLLAFLAQTHLDLGLCFDVGHANIMGGVEPSFALMKSRIRSTHVHDNDGTNDVHLFPTLASGGTVDWKKTMELLRTLDEPVPLLLELKESADFASPIDSARQILENLEAC